MLVALRRGLDWGRGFLAAARSYCSSSLAPQLSRRLDGMGRDGGALAARERPDPAKEPRVGWSRLLTALVGPGPAEMRIAARLPPAGSGGRGSAALSPARRPRRRKSIPPARSCPPRHHRFRGNPPLRGKSSIAGGSRMSRVKFSGSWGTAEPGPGLPALTRPGHLERWAGEA